jgi:hypothetical protein
MGEYAPTGDGKKEVLDDTSESWKLQSPRNRGRRWERIAKIQPAAAWCGRQARIGMARSWFASQSRMRATDSTAGCARSKLATKSVTGLPGGHVTLVQLVTSHGSFTRG